MLVLTFTDKSGNLVRIPYIFLLHVICDKEAFTNDVIILGGGALEKMTEGGGVGLKMTSHFIIWFLGKIQTIWF